MPVAPGAGIMALSLSELSSLCAIIMVGVSSYSYNYVAINF